MKFGKRWLVVKRSSRAQGTERVDPPSKRTGPVVECFATEMWRGHWSGCTWREYLAPRERTSELVAIRQYTQTGRPLGTAEFIGALEKETGRRLAPQKGGRPRKTTKDTRQGGIHFRRLAGGNVVFADGDFSACR